MSLLDIVQVKRSVLLRSIAAWIVAVDRPHPARIAIDGVDAAGKTTFADELIEPVRALGRPVIRGSVDDFHNPRGVRYRRGRDSPEGYFRDSFDYPTLRTVLLEPCGPMPAGAPRRCRRRAFDYESNSVVDAPLEEVPVDAVLLFDGIFLHRPELRSHWDLSIFLDVPFDVTIARCAKRDGVNPIVEDASNRRWVGGQRIYLSECNPIAAADIVIDNSELANPRFQGPYPTHDLVAPR